MNGNSKREFGLALASFAIGAVLVGVLGNSEAQGETARREQEAHFELSEHRVD